LAPDIKKGKLHIMNSAFPQLCDSRAHWLSPFRRHEPAVSCRHSSVIQGRAKALHYCC